ncbi:hypothetical protein R8Z50_02300 [Longispora sp. K20-0274]|uniref:hypothetical protein n=1 Tax=Longispora sp. K20-0274 TaxID=3088255 RepID=UPI00399AD0ED
MTQPAHDPTSGAETPEELSPLHNARPATLADLSAGDQARPVRRSVRPGQGIHGQSSELPPDMRQISASASVRPAPGGPAHSYPVIGGGELLSSADAGIPGPVQQAPAGYGQGGQTGGAAGPAAFGGDVPGAAAQGHVPGGASFSSSGSGAFGGAGTFGGAAPSAGFGGGGSFGGAAPGRSGSGATGHDVSASGPGGHDTPGSGGGFGADVPGSGVSGSGVGGSGTGLPGATGSPAQPPLPKPDESPTMILPIIGAVKPLTVRRVLAGAAGVIALIIAGLLVLNVMIPEEKKGATAPPPAQPVAQTTSLPATTPTPATVRHKPVTELCTKLETAPVKGQYPTLGAAAPTGLTCTVPLEFKPPAGTPPKPPMHRSGSVAGTAVYFPSGAEAVTAYGAKLTDPTTSLVSTVGSQAGMVTVPAGKTVTVTVHVLDDNLLLSFVFVAGREDRDWTAPEVDQLKVIATQVAAGTLAKL